nr:cell number regulator 1-like [Ipomoea batatas]GMD26489.1 cell number regulator 1-like [Ipomoea batatas]
MNEKEPKVKEDGENSLPTAPPVTMAMPIYDPNMTAVWPPPPPYYYPPMPMGPPPGPYYFAPYPPYYNPPEMGMGGYDPYNPDVVTLSQGSAIYSCYYRTKMRNKYALNGNIFMDFLVNFLCMKLSLCQQYRQLDRMGFDVGLGWHAYMEKQRINATEAAIQFMPPMMDHGMYR